MMDQRSDVSIDYPRTKKQRHPDEADQILENAQPIKVLQVELLASISNDKYPSSKCTLIISESYAVITAYPIEPRLDSK